MSTLDIDPTELSFEPININDLVHRYRGYTSLTDDEGYLDTNATDLEYDASSKYQDGQSPKNKVPGLQQQTLEPGRVVCLGKVLNPKLEEYYVVEVLDGTPSKLILVKESDLVFEES